MVRRIAVDLTSVGSSIIPAANVSYDLGTANNSWKDLFLSGNTISLAGATISTDPTSGAIAIVPVVTESNPNPKATIISATGVTSVNTTSGSVSSNVIAAAISSSYAGTSVTVYATVAELPLSDNTAGDQAFVSETGRLYLWNGAGWYNIALINTAPSITAAGDATYNFATDGTPIVITLEASDPEGVPISWSYSVTSGSLGSTATVSQADNIFTITPSTDANDAGEFSITFTASDGVNLATSVSAFTLSFGPDWSNPNLILTITGSGSSFSKSADFKDSHDYIIIGAVGESPRKAYIYDFNGTLVYTINNPRTNDTSDAFASSVAISGNVCVVAAVGYPNGSYYGRIYIYKTVLGNWSDTTLAYTIENPNTTGTIDDQFGTVVLIDGNYIVATAIKENVGGPYSGTAYVISAVNGSVLRTINNPNTYGSADNDRFGEFASMSGNYAIICTTYEDSAAGSNIGAAYIFNVTTGNLVKTLNSPGNSDGDTFGISSWIKGNYCVVGAKGAGGYSVGGGKAYVYKTESGDWSDATLLHTLNNANDYGTSSADNFGFTVALNDSHILVGADQEDAAGVTSVGRVYIFKLDDGSLVQTLLSPLNVTNAHFGASIRLTNTRAMIGTENNRAYFYEVS